MTLLVTSFLVDSVKELASRVERAWAGGADAVEIRMDAFDGDPATLAEYLKAHQDRTWIVTCRSAEEGGCFRGDTMERVSRLLAAARGTDAYVDFELADWRRSDNIRQKIELAAAADGQTRRLILSAHDFVRRPDNLDATVNEVIDACHAVAKVAYRGGHIADSFAALDLMCTHGSSVIAVCMGDVGLWSRILARKFDAFASLCTLAADEATAPGQTTLEEMTGLYRWKSIDRSTKVYGVIGDPIAHSMSPRLFNRWFAEAGLNAIYLPLRVAPEGDGLVRFLDGCRERPWLDLGGFSVTLPHKFAARQWVADGADHLSQWIGAVNTLAFGSDRPAGHNTDCYAAISSLCNALQCDRSALVGSTVDVLGAGGAARALVEGLREIGCKVTVYVRAPKSADPFLSECEVAVAAWEDRAKRCGEILINCTPVGLWPRADESPMPAESLRDCRLVFDMIYRPLQTPLLQDAATAGCATLNGLDMFVRQAAMQFEIWTGRTPDLQLARDWVRREIAKSLNLQNGECEMRKKKAIPIPHSAFRIRKGDKPCIALIGFRGCGKTIVGRELARILGGECFDTDERVAKRAGRSIAEVFATDGETGFRKLESEVIRDIVQAPPTVISVGGGAVLNPRNVEDLRAAATVVWLTSPSEVLWQRISTDPVTKSSRPPLTQHPGIEEVQRLLAERNPIYRQASDFQVETVGREPWEIAEEIVRRLQLPT